MAWLFQERAHAVHGERPRACCPFIVGSDDAICRRVLPSPSPAAQCPSRPPWRVISSRFTSSIASSSPRYISRHLRILTGLTPTHRRLPPLFRLCATLLLISHHHHPFDPACQSSQWPRRWASIPFRATRPTPRPASDSATGCECSHCFRPPPQWPSLSSPTAIVQCLGPVSGWPHSIATSRARRDTV